jgi:hypothetical protein
MQGMTWFFEDDQPPSKMINLIKLDHLEHLRRQVIIFAKMHALGKPADAPWDMANKSQLSERSRMTRRLEVVMNEVR